MIVAFARYWRILLNRKELESLSFLFMPQATVHQVTNPFKDLDWLEGSAEQGKHGRGNGRDGPHSRKTVHEPSTWEDLNATWWASWPPSARSHVASFSRDWCSSICKASAGHAHHEDYTGDVTLSNLVKPCQTLSNLVKTFEQIRRVGRWVTTIPGWTILQRQTWEPANILSIRCRFFPQLMQGPDMKFVTSGTSGTCVYKKKLDSCKVVKN